MDCPTQIPPPEMNHASRLQAAAPSDGEKKAPKNRYRLIPFELMRGAAGATKCGPLPGSPSPRPSQPRFGAPLSAKPELQGGTG